MGLFKKTIKQKNTTNTEIADISASNNEFKQNLICVEDIKKIFEKLVLEKRRERNIMSFYGDEPIWYYTEDAIKIMANYTDLFFDYLKVANYESLECISDLLGPIAYYMGELFYNSMRNTLLVRTKEFQNTQFDEFVTSGTYEEELKHYFPDCYSFVKIDLDNI